MGDKIDSRSIATIDGWFNMIQQVTAMCLLPGPAANNILRVSQWAALNAKIAKCVALPSHKSCVVYLTKTKKNKNSAPSHCHYCADRARSLPWPAPNIWLTAFQISSKSVYLWRSNSRPREGCQNAPVFPGADRLLPSLRPRRSLSTVCVNRRQMGTVACKLCIFR